jgi:hypothetical protein
MAAVTSAVPSVIRSQSPGPRSLQRAASQIERSRRYLVHKDGDLAPPVDVMW